MILERQIHQEIVPSPVDLCDVNTLFKSHLDRLIPGKVIIPDDHTADNSMYAASKGWDTYTFDVDHTLIQDLSQKVRTYDWNINVTMGGYEDTDYESESMDMVAFLDVDIPSYIRQSYFRNLLKPLKKGGIVLLDANHTDNKSMRGNEGAALNEELMKRIFNGFSSIVTRKVENPYLSGPSRRQSHFYKLQVIAIK